MVSNQFRVYIYSEFRHENQMSLS